MKNCVQTVNVFGFPLRWRCGSSLPECVDDEAAANFHKTECFIDRERCLVHVYSQEDEFLTFVKDVLRQELV